MRPIHEYKHLELTDTHSSPILPSYCAVSLDIGPDTIKQPVAKDSTLGTRNYLSYQNVSLMSPRLR